MMLTGMVSNQHNLLVRGELDAQTTIYPGCQCVRDPNDTTSTLIHRVTSCTQTKSCQTVLPKGRQGLDKIRAVFMETDKSVSKMDLLKILTKIAI